MAKNMAAHAPQVNPKAYLPISAANPWLWNALRARTKTALERSEGVHEGRGLFTHVIREAARVYQKRAKPKVTPETPEAKRLNGARKEVKKAMTAKIRPMR